MSVVDHITSMSVDIWDKKYRLKDKDGTPIDTTIEDTWRRIAKSLASVEVNKEEWEHKFYGILEDFKFLPGGRIISGAGTDRNVTLPNCFVSGIIEDDLGSIFDKIKEAALTMQQGGGIGYDFSTVRPNGTYVAGVAAEASGPVSFMEVFDSMCKTIMSGGSRRGAMMGCLRCDHPDIELFIAAKQSKRLNNFNMSVLVTDDFMYAVKCNKEWELKFNDKVYKTVKARDLWDNIIQNTYNAAEPGVIFIDRINSLNNLYYCETIYATNPCGEQPLPPYGACLLGSINLTRFIESPFTDSARVDKAKLAVTVATAVRMLDNVIEVTKIPLPEQLEEMRAKRRIGLGITGLGDALIMLGLPYGSNQAVKVTDKIMESIRITAYEESSKLANEKGVFPVFDRESYLLGNFVSQRLTDELNISISKHGMRNSHLISVAPTGTISLLADNISGGVEPVFALEYTRKVLQKDGSKKEETVQCYAMRLYKELYGDNAVLPDYFITAQDITPSDHIRMQAVVQKHVDSAVSKTINCPESITFDDFKNVYMDAYDAGCKGCTTYRPNDITGSVLAVETTKDVMTISEQESKNKDIVSNETKESKITNMGKKDTDLLERNEVLMGRTYKLTWPDSPHALYVTINDIEDNGVIRPFEIFVNSKNMDHYSWVIALTRMISAVFRRKGDVSFVADELKQVFDPRGGSWSKGRYVPSLVAALGGIIEQHLNEIGETKKTEKKVVEVETKINKTGNVLSQSKEICPQCGQPGLIKGSGCSSCPDCGYSKCG